MAFSGETGNDIFSGQKDIFVSVDIHRLVQQGYQRVNS